jgi:hypothetical protein
MRFVVEQSGDKWLVRDTQDPDGNVSNIGTQERAEKIAARLNEVYV